MSTDHPVHLLLDDNLLVGDRRAVQGAKERLQGLFTTTDLGSRTHFLEIKIERLQSGLSISKRPLAKKIRDLAVMNTAKPKHAPILLSQPLYEEKRFPTVQEQESFTDVLYQEVFGSLLFLATGTRLDLGKTVSMLGKLEEASQPVRWKAMKANIRYLITLWKSELPSFPVSRP